MGGRGGGEAGEGAVVGAGAGAYRLVTWGAQLHHRTGLYPLDRRYRVPLVVQWLQPRVDFIPTLAFIPRVGSKELSTRGKMGKARSHMSGGRRRGGNRGGSYVRVTKCTAALARTRTRTRTRTKAKAKAKRLRWEAYLANWDPSNQTR